MSSIKQRFLVQDKIPESEYEGVESARKALFTEAEQLNLLLSHETDSDITKIKNIASRIRNEFRNLIVIGTGASESIPRMFSDLGDSKLNIKFLSSPEESYAKKLLSDLDLNDTCILVISKSGETVEIIALTIFVLNQMKMEVPEQNLATHFYFITTESDNAVYRIAKSIGASIIAHPKTGGRFSSFSSLGFLMAGLSGLDIDLIINYAKHYFAELIKSDSWVMQGVAYNNWMSKKFSTNIFMYYNARFEGTSLWVRQIVAESLGKESKGVNLAISSGVLDHHSQLQLYLDGLNDKFFTVIYFKDSVEVKNVFDKKDTNKFEVDFLYDLALDDIKSIQMNSAIKALAGKGKNLRILEVQNSKEEFLAEFIMGTMLEIVMVAYIQDINPFGQPAVEEMKKAFEFKKQRDHEI